MLLEYIYIYIYIYIFGYIGHPTHFCLGWVTLRCNDYHSTKWTRCMGIFAFHMALWKRMHPTFLLPVELGFLIFIKQLVYESKNAKMKPVKLRLKTDPLSHHAWKIKRSQAYTLTHTRAQTHMYIYICIEKITKEKKKGRRETMFISWMCIYMIRFFFLKIRNDTNSTEKYFVYIYIYIYIYIS